MTEGLQDQVLPLPSFHCTRVLAREGVICVPTVKEMDPKATSMEAGHALQFLPRVLSDLDIELLATERMLMVPPEYLSLWAGSRGRKIRSSRFSSATVSVRLAWDTQDSVSKSNKTIKKKKMHLSCQSARLLCPSTLKQCSGADMQCSMRRLRQDDQEFKASLEQRK